jgi:hypothetical protein
MSDDHEADQSEDDPASQMVRLDPTRLELPTNAASGATKARQTEVLWCNS